MFYNFDVTVMFDNFDVNAIKLRAYKYEQCCSLLEKCMHKILLITTKHLYTQCNCNFILQT